MKVVTILGARPQFIKAATVSRELAVAGIKEIIVHTGQHFDYNMSQVFFDEMEIPLPHYNLDIHGLTHGAMTGRMLEKIETILLSERPEAVIVYGDTNSTLAGALAASKLHIRLIHIEAGLRSFDMNMPEEINRILTDRISNVLFCPTQTAVHHLEAEGYRNFKSKIHLSGDVMYDAVVYYRHKIPQRPPVLVQYNPQGKPFILATLHRAENTDEPSRFREIIQALNEISENQLVIMPLHPRTRALLESSGILLKINLIPPVGYFEMLALLQHCSLVMTDSGGLQKEAYFFDKHCITFRDQTEWTELVDAGVNVVAGADCQKITKAYFNLAHQPMKAVSGLYGDGHAARFIASHLFD